MSKSVVLPALGESVTEGTVTRWLKKVGDTVEVDEGLLEISTDKVDTEIPSPVGGVIEEILVQEDETVEVGAVLATIGDGSGAAGLRARRRGCRPRRGARRRGARARPRLRSPSRPAAAAAPAAAARAARGRAGGKDVVLPELGESVTEGTVTRWLKKVGDAVAVDEPLLEISTDKVDTEIPSPFAGVLRRSSSRRTRPSPSAPRSRASARQRAPPRQRRRLRDARRGPGSRRSRTGSAAAPAPAPAPAPGARRRCRHPLLPLRPRPPPAAPAPRRGRVGRLGRRLATSLRSCASSRSSRASTSRRVTGTGVGGRIRKEDVLHAAAAASAPAAGSLPLPPLRPPSRSRRCAAPPQPMSRLRKVVAERAVVSMQSTAQLTTVVEVDVTKLANFRDKVKGDFHAEDAATSSRSCRSSPSRPPRRCRRTRSSTRRSTATDIVYPATREHLDRGRHRARPAHAGAPRRRRPRTSRRSPTRSPISPRARATTSSSPTSSPAARSR